MKHVLVGTAFLAFCSYAQSQDDGPPVVSAESLGIDKQALANLRNACHDILVTKFADDMQYATYYMMAAAIVPDTETVQAIEMMFVSPKEPKYHHVCHYDVDKKKDGSFTVTQLYIDQQVEQLSPSILQTLKGSPKYQYKY